MPTKPFQSTLLRRSDIFRQFLFRTNLDFNPRSCEGATILPNQYFNNTFISIHAPAKERHCSFVEYVSRGSFQSTLLRRSDSLTSCDGHVDRLFQSTLLRRSDENPWAGFKKGLLISIHAPAKERHTGANYDEFLVIFQSTLLRRSDHFLSFYVII